MEHKYVGINFLQLMLVVGGQAPKAIRSVEVYDFKEERWTQVAEMPSRRCRAGMYGWVMREGDRGKVGQNYLCKGVYDFKEERLTQVAGRL